MGAKTERDYLEAVAAYYQDFGKRSERERQVARAKAYEALAAKYPKDDSSMRSTSPARSCRPTRPTRRTSRRRSFWSKLAAAL